MRPLAMSVVLNHARLPHSFAILPTSVWFAILDCLRNAFDETTYIAVLHLDNITFVRLEFFMNPGEMPARTRLMMM